MTDDNTEQVDRAASLKRVSGQAQDVHVYHQIFDAILTQRLMPGMKLKEEELTEIFDVSRAVVRRALLRLSHERIVEIRPNRGAIVSSLSAQEAKEVLAARRLIESEIVRVVVTVATPVQFEELRTLVAEEQRCFEQGDYGGGLRLSGDFHLRLAQISGNLTLTKFLKELVPRTSLIITQYERRGHSSCSYAEHFQLIEMFEKGTAKDAVALMAEHLRHIEDKLNLAGESTSTDLRVVFAHVIKERQEHTKRTA